MIVLRRVRTELETRTFFSINPCCFSRSVNFKGRTLSIELMMMISSRSLLISCFSMIFSARRLVIIIIMMIMMRDGNESRLLLTLKSLFFFTLLFLSLCSSQNINHFLHFLMMLTNLPFVVTTEESNSKPEEGNLLFSSCSHKRHESHQRA